MGDVQLGEDTLPGHRGRGEVLRDAGQGIQVQPYLGKCTKTLKQLLSVLEAERSIISVHFPK